MKFILPIILLLVYTTYAQVIEKIPQSEMKGNAALFKSSKINYPGDANIDIKYYKLNLKIDYNSQNLIGEVTVDAESNKTGLDSIFLDLVNSLAVDSIKVNQTKLAFTRSTNKVNILLNREYSQNEKFSLIIYYHGKPLDSGFGGFTFDTHNSQPLIWTLSEPYEAKNWFPCKDTPADKADSSDVWVTSDSFFKVVSNGTLEDVIDNGDGTSTYKWKNHYPIAHYLISIAMTNYEVITDYFKYSKTDSMPVINYVYPEYNTQTTKNQVKRTLEALRIFSDLYGPYPWLDEKYGHAQCGFGGGMEHQTIASMGGFDENLIVHELAHQWFGDKITCRDWENIWLNEGFATYSEALYKEMMYGKSAYDNHINLKMNSARNAVGSIYVRDISSLWEIFSSSRSYSKGATVLHMLRGIVGDSDFFNILKSYSLNPLYENNVVVTEDFQNVAESISGQNLEYFFNEWIYGENYPKYKLIWNYINTQENNYQVEFNLTQTKNSNPIFFTMPVEIKITTTTGDTLVTIFNNQMNQNFQVNVTGEPQSIVFDPNNWILKGIEVLTAIEDQEIPNNFKLYQNFPNPFNPSTKINFSIPGTENEYYVTLKIFDILGNEKVVLVNGIKASGEHSIEFNPGIYGLSSGIYFYRINFKLPEKYNMIFSSTKKMLYLR